MVSNQNLVCNQWIDYELLDSGEGEKLERFGEYVISTTYPRAIWKKDKKEIWKVANAIYERSSEGGGKWIKNEIPENWEISKDEIKIRLKTTGFKHIGFFPEQTVYWDILKAIIEKKSSNNQQNRILNLFGYTGTTSVFLAKNGAHVTHVDSSEEIIEWAKANYEMNNAPFDNKRWIVDDAVKFVQREVRRGAKYDGIIIDPPKFGRGNKGQVWKIENDLQKLIEFCKELLSDKPLFLLINTYSTDLSAITLRNLVSQSIIGTQNIQYGELIIKLVNSDIELPMSIYCLVVMN